MRGLTILLALFCSTVLANNARIGAVHVLANDRLEVELSWEHAWNLNAISPYNHDALWVFGKYRLQNGHWQHLDLASYVDSSKLLTNEAMIKPVVDGKGIFVLPRQTGTHDAISTRVEIPLKSAFSNGNIDLRLFAIEMVYVPTDTFYAGDGSSFFSLGQAPGFSPYLINSENAILRDSLNGFAADSGKQIAANIPVDYPKGYAGFYCMKYELSQEQFADFLNSLDPKQQAAHMPVSQESSAGTFALGQHASASRNGLIVLESGNNLSRSADIQLNANGNFRSNEYDDGGNRACNRLKWENLTAYLDWACLRPMSELEFEKACRGPLVAVAGEFAWGTDTAVDAETVLYDGTKRETVEEKATTQAGLANYGQFNLNGLGALRNGFAGTDSSKRLDIGASYYGICEMSGNLWEQVIHLGEDGMSFSRNPGDGQLDANGYADESGWCPQSGDCAGHKGGGFQSAIYQDFRDMAVSDRYYIYLNPNILRRNTAGGRGVR